MKHKFLTLATLAVALFAGTQSASAQFDDGEYLLKNVETGKFLQGDSYWGTKAVAGEIPYLVTLTKVSDGVYTIKSQTNNGGNSQYIGSGADPYADAAACNMTFTADGDYYTINNGTGNLYTVPTTLDNATVYLVNAGTETGNAAKWQVISKASVDAEMTAASEATLTDPVNATIYIKDAGFDVHSVNNAWSSPNSPGGGNAGHCIESWNSASFDTYQTVTGLPNGKYKLTCRGYYRWNSAAGGNNNSAAITAHSDNTEVLNAKLYAGDKSVSLMSVANYEGTSETLPYSATDCDAQWKAAANFTAGYFLNELTDILVTDGTLKIGVKKDTQAGQDWTVFDNFQLYYYGVDLTALQENLAARLDVAKAITGKMNATVATALSDAISAAESCEATKSALETATSDLNTAIDNANASVAEYTTIAGYNTSAETLDAAGQAAYASTLTAYNEGTLTSAAEALAALQAAAKAQTTAGADMTLAITNNDFTGCSNGNFPGWTISAPKGGNTWKNGDTAVEYWQASAANGQFDYYQTLSDMPNGKYTVTGKMWNSTNGESGVTFAATSGAYAKNGTRAGWGLVDEDCANGAMIERTSDEVVVYDGTIQIGVANKETMAARWFGVDWIKLTYVGAASDDEIAEAKAADDAAALAAAKEELAAAIAAAPAVPTEHISDAAFDYNQASVTALSDALTTAQGVCDDASATLADVQAQTTAVKALTAPSLNAPASTQAYKIILKYDGWTYNNCAMTAEAGARSDMGNYNVQYVAQNPNYAQAMYFTQVEGGYNISWTDADGNTRYLCTGTPYSGNNNQIRTTTTAADAMVITVTRNGDYINLYNVAASNYIGSQDAGVYTVNSHINFVVEETTAVNAISKTVADGKYATVCLPYAVASVSGAYEATVNGSYVTLNAVTALEANKAYILGAGTYNFSGVSVAYAEPTAGTGLNGVFTATAVPVGSYVMQTQSGTQQFYKVEAENQPTLDANKAYLTTSSDAKSLAIGFADEEATGINAINALVNGTAKIYDINGRQLNSLQKGVNIVNGVKVMVK